MSFNRISGQRDSEYPLKKQNSPGYGETHFQKNLPSPVHITKFPIGALITIPVFAAESDWDTSFDGDGKATASSFYEEGGRDVVIQPDGEIIVVGGKPSGFYTHNMVAVRYNSNGSLDALIAPSRMTPKKI